MPDVATMGVIGAVALVANLVCFLLLFKHRDDNLNMSSTWLCSRNDLIANVGVLLAASGSYALASRWPDIIVGVIVAGLFFASSLSVLSGSITGLLMSAAPRTRPGVSRYQP
jgi:Co/Zn/Cd efflux system component